ncbi:hypothetical protein HZB07_03635, partial [Candidatus Saganbacteria bacterium]|nr:hypothetical protein [Candidatus Saganbacteria bacterium]
MSGTIGPLPPPRRFNGPQAVSPSGRRLPLSSKIPEAIRTRILAHVTTFLEQRLETSLSFGLFSIGLAIDLLGQIGEIAELDLLDRLLASLEQELGVAAQKVRLAQVKIATQHDSPKAQTYQEKLILKYEEILAGAARGSGLGDAKTFLESLKLLLYYFSADQSNRFKGIYIRLKSLDDRIRMIKATGVEPKEHMAFALVIGLLGDRDEALRHCAEIMGLWNVAVKAKSARLEYYFVMSDNIPLFARYLNKLVAMEGKEERLTQTEGAIIAGFSNFADKLGDLPLVYTEAVAEFFSSPDDNALRMAAFARLRSILECDDRGTTEMKEALAVIDDLQLNALLPDLIKIKESLSAADFREYHKINFICALAGALARLGKTTQALELLNRIISVPGNLINKAAIAKAAGKCGTTAGLTLLEKIASQANDFILGLSFLVENWRGESRQQPTVPNPLYEQAESLAKLVLAASQKARPEVGSASGFANQGIHRSAPQKGRAAASHGFDFRNMRKLYVGDSVGHGRLVYRGDDVYEAEFETTQASPAMVVVDPRLLEGNRKKVALTAGAIAGVNYRNQDPVGLMIGTGEGGGAVKPQREKGLSHIIFKILNGAANKPSLLEMLDRAYAHVPDGGRVYLVANFAEQAELLQPNAKGETKLGRSIAGRRAKQITVIPVQYGVDVFPSFEMQIGQHKFAVNDVVARKMSDVGDNLKTFLSKHQGIAVESLCTSEIMLQKTIAAAAQPGVDLPAFDMTILEPAEVIPVESTSPAPRHMIKLLSWAIKNNNRLLVAKILFCAKVFGWVEIFDWLEARLAKIKPNNAWRGYFYLPSHPTPRAQGDLGPTQQSVNVLIFNDAFSLTPLKVASLWGKKIEQKDSDKILNGFIKEATPESVLPFQTALNKACARNWSDIITLEAWGYDVDKVLMGLNPKANRMAQLGTPAQRQHLAKTNISSPAQSGAREEKKGDHHNWLSVERRLAGRDIYLLGMVVGEWDAAHCQHREIPGLGLEAIQLGG